MATLSIEVTLQQATTAKAALGRKINEDQSPASTAQAEEWIWSQVKTEVQAYRAWQRSGQATIDAAADVADEGW